MYVLACRLIILALHSLAPAARRSVSASAAARRRRTFTTFIRLSFATLALVGPLAAIAVTGLDSVDSPKRGAGLVLLVSLQRQSMS